MESTDSLDKARNIMHRMLQYDGIRYTVSEDGLSFTTRDDSRWIIRGVSPELRIDLEVLFQEQDDYGNPLPGQDEEGYSYMFTAIIPWNERTEDAVYALVANS